MTDHRGRLLVAARGFAALSALPMTCPPCFSYARAKEIGDEDVSCSTSCCCARTVPV